VKGKRFKTLCLNDNIATLTSWANDVGYEDCFSEQLANWVEEGNRSIGVGAEISARIMEETFDSLDAPIRRVTAKDVPIPFSRNLERAVLPDTEKIICQVKKLI